MSATVLERHYKDRVQSLRQIALPDHGQIALAQREIEDVAALCLVLSLSGRQLLEAESHVRVVPVTTNCATGREELLQAPGLVVDPAEVGRS